MPDRHEHHRERLAARRTRALHDARRELEARQARTREHRQLLAPHQRIHAVDGADARLDEVGGPERRAGFIGMAQSGTRASPTGGGRPSAGWPMPLNARPSSSLSHRGARHLARQGDLCIRGRETDGVVEQLDHASASPASMTCPRRGASPAVSTRTHSPSATRRVCRRKSSGPDAASRAEVGPGQGRAHAAPRVSNSSSRRCRSLNRSGAASARHCGRARARDAARRAAARRAPRRAPAPRASGGAAAVPPWRVHASWPRSEHASCGS
jgi:hypothetical protein